MYNLIKKLGALWQYHKDKLAVNDTNGNIFVFPGNSALFKSKVKKTGKPLTLK